MGLGCLLGRDVLLGRFENWALGVKNAADDPATICRGLVYYSRDW